jgi:hypothetical protein
MTMTAKNLSTVAADLIECYGNTAKNVIDAYRAGGERVVTVLEQRWNAALKQSRSQLTMEVAKNASAAQLAFSVYYTKGLTHTTQGAELVVNQLLKLAEAGVERVAANASLFEERTGLSTLNTLADVSKPGAAILSQFAAKLEEKSAALASKIAGDNSTTASVKHASPFSQRRAAKAA